MFLRRYLRLLSRGVAGGRLTPTAIALLLLVAVDLLFVILHLVSVETGWLRRAGISLEADGGPAERYQYMKELWIAICMAALYWRTRISVYAVWSLLFAFLLIDDAGQLHERIGVWMGEAFALPSAFGLRPDDTGELIFASLVGTTTIAAIVMTSLRAPEGSLRVSFDVLGLVVMLGVLGVFVDMLHVVAYLSGSLFAQLLLVVEDGGEMLVLSALAAYAFHIERHGGRSYVDLWGEAMARMARPWMGEARSSGRA